MQDLQARHCLGDGALCNTAAISEDDLGAKTSMAFHCRGSEYEELRAICHPNATPQQSWKSLPFLLVMSISNHIQKRLPGPARYRCLQRPCGRERHACGDPPRKPLLGQRRLQAPLATSRLTLSTKYAEKCKSAKRQADICSLISKRPTLSTTPRDHFANLSSQVAAVYSIQLTFQKVADYAPPYQPTLRFRLRCRE